MKRTSSFSLPAALALFVVTAHPQGETKDSGSSASANATRSEEDRITQQQRNQQSTFDPPRVSDSELKKTVTDLNKASSFTKMAVQNMQNEKLGTVNDIVFDPETGKVSYAVLSVGGFLGVGEKLLAVPLTSLRPQPGQNYLVLNMTKDQLKSAPGLAKNNWPKLNDPALGSPAAVETSSGSSISNGATSRDTSNSDISTDKSNQPSSVPADQSSTKSSDRLSDSSSYPPASTGNDAQGSSPSTTSSSSSANASTDTSGKDSGASDATGSNSDSSSSSPKP